MFRTSRKTSGIRKTGRRSPLASVSLIALGLLLSGGAYALVSSSTAVADTSSTATQATVEEGEKLFQANCATCHGLNLEGSKEGPSLIGVGEAAVDFQVGTGRMPLQANAPQAPVKPVQFTDEQISALAQYVGSVSPGPAIPEDKYLDADGDAARGAELFRVNCAMCHNVAGAGGALTEGKYAPELTGVTETHIYEAMLTGPQNMPVFNDANLTPEDKRDIITALKFQENSTSVGGHPLGSLGPVAEGLFLWIAGMGIIVALTVWITARSN
ncbi:menaquinol-cytochrome c reductase cytochrome c1 subunit precursor [Labedella gwakjiensis]|uniref:Cytochrome bc1 complex cytochrome c subunit n=1 Tax=Labedella gwakjiensis TaxID=390269 RepID=A0A2P8H075_9MICO|nr:cytochrome c [Labedella gwakjiensis]PSL39590.1 menaquinol-cytochrome c reductase cytochrome c1 subunit precursor [Labedella gwakjiensis]RUQ86016.1 c-type cytochrome [Labedella gwakjiensis]